MSTCESGSEFHGDVGIKISSIFVIFVGSFLGAYCPVFVARKRSLGLRAWLLFATKYFGSGVIVATAFLHLLAPAHEALLNPCLTGPITGYPWVEGICLMSVFAMFFVEFLSIRYNKSKHPHEPVEMHTRAPAREEPKSFRSDSGCELDEVSSSPSPSPDQDAGRASADVQVVPISEPYVVQLTGVFILEFGVIFHSVFIGLTLAVAGEEFKMLYGVLALHQTFEGLALGSRLASIQWPQRKRYTPLGLAILYALSTPVAIAIGLGLRSAYHSGSATALIINGIFDSISAGILIYTGLVELMAHDFIFNSDMQRAPISKVLLALGTMCSGAFIMALLGKWA
ncbi:low-affinity Zn(2+) transporter zrt2 [Vermiconidia calcicola]|uniref:Low-affinity Zn(2+) transporter zrt2 n=1 Tax=Vermiconidia calcicola TaxID=1690605 RepID=A0ACC3N7T3_9PEZI|nr:low-affinity Zn(2+) transporter zrt2 [Vermiconidia calcicola]